MDGWVWIDVRILLDESCHVGHEEFARLRLDWGRILKDVVGSHVKFFGGEEIDHGYVEMDFHANEINNYNSGTCTALVENPHQDELLAEALGVAVASGVNMSTK